MHAYIQTDGAVENAEQLEINKLKEQIKRMKEEKKLQKLKAQVCVRVCECMRM
jgi:hypothetical protein